MWANNKREGAGVFPQKGKDRLAVRLKAMVFGLVGGVKA